MKGKQKLIIKNNFNRSSASKTLLSLLIPVICTFTLACENPFITAILPEKSKSGAYEYTVTFDLNNGSAAPYALKTVKYPDTTIDALPDDPEWAGHIFKNWNTLPGGSGSQFTASEPVIDDITVFAQWEVWDGSSLGGEASITGAYRINQTLSVDTTDIFGAQDTNFRYQWKADEINVSTDAVYTIQGADAGKKITCVITHDAAEGKVTAQGEIVPYDIVIRISETGKVEGDSTIANPDYGIAGADIVLNYVLINIKKNNQLDFSGTDANINTVTVTGPGDPAFGIKNYTVNAVDASAEGVITINVTFIHTDKTIDHIAFADSHNENKTYGDAPYTRAIANNGAGSGGITYASSDAGIASVNAGTGEVTILAIGTASITAEKAGDEFYETAVASYTLTVSRKTVTVDLSADDKDYDGTADVTFAALPVVTGRVGADDVNFIYDSAGFINKNAGTGKAIIFVNESLTGAKADNYNLTAPSITAAIRQLQLTITDPAITKTKQYDGVSTAAVTAGALNNKIAGDTVNADAAASYASINAGSGIQITVVYGITGADFANYIKPADYIVNDGVINKADGAAVSVPSESSKTQTSITVNPVTITNPAAWHTVEYAISASTTVPANGWQTVNIFSGLQPNTDYYIFARTKGNDNVNAGAESRSAAIKTNASAGAPIPFTKIDFEADAIGSTSKYTSTRGANYGTVTIAADPHNAGQRSLNYSASGNNQAAIIPLNLPYELNNYQSFTFRARGISGSDIANKNIMVYISSDASESSFKQYGFGNPSDSQYPQFANLLIGQTQTVTLSDSWTNFTITINNPDSVISGIKGNAFIAIGINSTSAIYMLDDIDFVLKSDFEPPPPPPSFPQPPSTGAVASGNYRNVFLERGLWTQTQIDAKVQTSWDRLFDPNASENYRIYYEVSTTNGPGAYILDSGNNDVRSEGMSYGMMMAVQMNNKNMFDRLWTWAKTYMYRTTNTSNNNRGYFNWSQKTDGSNSQTGIAPDGEFYFATALLFAHARWGSDTGTGTMVPGSGSGSTNTADIKNYRWHAMLLLFDMCHREMGTKDPWDAPALFRRPGDHRLENTAANPMSIGNYMPVFSPIGQSAKHTDPSYHLPSFNEVWAYELKKDANAGVLHGIWTSAADMLADAAFYETCAQTSRDFFDKALHPVTGLSSDYATFEGVPTGSDHDFFAYDAFRTIKNIAMDYAWWAKDARQKTYADRLQTFFHAQGVNTYKALWNIDGTPRSNPGDHSPGLVACNAAASLAATHERAWDFIEDFWNISMTPGQYRYYDGCLYMFGMLHLSGNFKVYLSGGTYVSDSSISPTTAAFDKRPSQRKDITVEMTLHGNEFISIQNGQTTLTQGTHYTRSGDTITLLSSYLAALNNGNTTLTFNFSAGRSRSIDINVSTSTASNSTITPTTAVFAKYAQTDIPVTMTLNGNTFVRIQNGVTTLTQGSNYTVSGSNVTINKSYLSGLESGAQTLTFYFSEGNNAVLNVTIQEYMPSEIDPAAAIFYKDIKNNIEVTMTLNSNSFTEVRNNTTPLTLNTDYTMNGNTVTILGNYLDNLTGAQATLTFVFNQGGNKQLVISIKEVNPDRMVVIDFEGAAPAITFTGGGGTPTASIATNPTVPNEKSLQISVTGGNNWNRAPIIPINLPQELQYYKSISFRYYVQSVTGATNRDFRLYADSVNNSFPSNQFGNSNTYFNDRMIGGFQIDLTDTGAWREHTMQISSLPSQINNLKGSAFIAIGFNHGDPYTYFLDDITFVLKDDFVVPATISPVSAVFYKAASEQEDIPVTMTLNGLSLTGIQNGGAALVSGTNYTISGDVVTIQKSYLAGLDTGKTTLTFNFNKGPNSSFEITVENDKASAMILSYNFANSINAGSIVHSGGSNLNVTWNETEGALQVVKSNNGTNYYITLPFNLGSTNLSAYKLVVTMRGIGGDYTNKPFGAAISAGASLGSINNSSLSASYKDVELTALPSATGSIDINFNFINNNANAYTIQIKEIKLVLK